MYLTINTLYGCRHRDIQADGAFFAGAEEQPHFDRPSFRVNGKIFATLWEKENRAMLKLPLIEQSVFCSYDNAVFFPVPGSWGLKGATLVELKKVRRDMLKDALGVAYNGVMAKKAKK